MNSDFIEAYSKMSPKSVEGITNALTVYYMKRLYNILVSRFTFDNVPASLNIDEMLSVFINGVIAVADTGQGIYSLPCAVYGIDVYDNPTKVSISNHHIIKTEYTIGKDCELIYIDRYRGNYASAFPLLLHFAQKLASVDQSLNTSLINSRVAFMFRGSNTKELESFKLMYDEISQGKPAVFMRKAIDDDGNSVLFNNVKNTYVGNDLLITKRMIMNEFLSAIGINNANTDKRERLNSDEVHANDIEIYANVTLWLNNLRESLSNVNKLFNFNITVSLTDYMENVPEVSNELV